MLDSQIPRLLIFRSGVGLGCFFVIVTFGIVRFISAVAMIVIFVVFTFVIVVPVAIIMAMTVIVSVTAVVVKNLGFIDLVVFATHIDPRGESKEQE